MTKLLRISIGALAGLLALSFVGCSHKGDGDAAGTTGDKPAGAKLRIVYIPKNTGNPYFDDVIKGFKDEAGKVNADFTTTAPATADETSQISYIKEQVQKGVDVIAITPNSPDALNPSLDAARAKGVIVITVDADLTGSEEHRNAAVLPTDFALVGPGQLDTLASELPSGGEIAILSATREASNQNAWIKGIQEALKTPKYASLKLVDVVYGNDDPEKSSTEAQGLLTKHPNLRGIIAPTTAGLAATAQTLEIGGEYPGGPHAVGGGVILTGLGTPNQMKPYLDKGVVAKFQLWSPHDMGVLACYLADGLKSGKIKPDEGTEVDVPGLGKCKFGAKGVITAGPLVTFDKSNIANYNF